MYTAQYPSLIASALFLLACANDDSPSSDAASREFALCSKGSLESDMEVTLPPTGPGVDPSTGQLAPGSYHIATTYLALRPGKEALAGELAGPIVQSMFETSGLVAVTTARSSSCAALRTLTVWETEEAMFAFVASPAHVRAMAQTTEVSRGTSNTIAWSGTGESATWAEAEKRLGAEQGGEI